jgi:hypothetical protein
MEIGRGHLGGSVEHSEGKDDESAVAISRFLCGSPHLCRLRTEGFLCGTREHVLNVPVACW